MDEELPLCTTSTYECRLHAFHRINCFRYDRRGIPTFLVYPRKVANAPQTLEARKHHPDIGIQLLAYWKRKARGSEADLPPYYTLLTEESTILDIESSKHEKKFTAESSSGRKQYEFRGIWTFNIIGMLLAQAIFDFHMG